MLAMDVPGCHILAIESVGQILMVTIRGNGERQRCPSCCHESDDVHSTYVRTPWDLPVQGRGVRLQIVVRRWKCLNRTCSRKTFCETFVGFVKRHAQRTDRMTRIMEHLILNISSNTGAHLALEMGMEVSARTLLRVVDHGEVLASAPRVLGVDDFALRRGRTYGTLLVDLEAGKPIDMLLGRSRQPLQRWLEDHPGIEVVVRDRASAYADAVKFGAPHATQVADRFHLVRNVSDALKEVVDRQSWAISEPAPLPVFVSESQPIPEPESAPESQPAKRLTKAEEKRVAAAGRLERRYEETLRLQATGVSLRQIRRATGLAIQTIQKYINASGVPKRAEPRRVPSKLDPFVDYLDGRWQAGCHRMQTLYEEIVQQGYTGSISRLNHLLQPWRAECPPAPAKAPQRSPQKPDRHKRTVTWKETRAALLCPPESLNPDGGRLLRDCLALQPPLALAHSLLQRFRLLFHEHDTDAFAAWLSDAAECQLAPFERLAKTLSADCAAVLGAIKLPWSTGPVEGHITRVKLLKRIGYGRASLALLRARVLNSAQRDNCPRNRKQRSRKGVRQHATA